MPGSLPSGPRYDYMPQREVPAPDLFDLLAFAEKYDTLRPPASDIRKVFGISELTYQACLIRVADDEVANAMAPELMGRVRERRDRYRRRRSSSARR